MKYQEIIPLIKTTIESVPEVKQVFASPQTRYSKFPAVIFYPADFDNVFETNAENFKTYNFVIYVIVGLKQASVDDAFTEVMPKVVDALVEKFDQEWNQGPIDGHQTWARITSGLWNTAEYQNAEIAFAQLNLGIKLLTNI